MPIAVACKCGQQFRAKDELAGRQMKCPKCGAIFQVPGGATPQQTAVPQGGGTDLDALMQMDQTAGMGMPQQGMQGGFQPGPGGFQQQNPFGGTYGGHPRSKKSSGSPVRLIVGICAGLVIVIAVVIIAIKLSGGSDETASNDGTEGSNTQGTTDPNRNQVPTLNEVGGPNNATAKTNTNSRGSSEENNTETTKPAEEEIELTEFDLITATNMWLDKGESLQGMTIVDENLPEIYAFSWMTQILPYVGEEETFEEFDFDTVFIEGPNRGLITAEIAQFLNPNQEKTRFEGLYFTGMGLTHFVGMSGAEDTRTDLAARLSRSDPKAGVFGYDEVALLKDISDGTSNTLLLIGSEKTAGPWVSGGGSTIRGARKGDYPYLGGYYGFWSEGTQRPGALASLADGSVHEIPEDIDPAVFRSMSTIAGGESDLDRSVLAEAEDDVLPIGIMEKLIAAARAKKSQPANSKNSNPGDNQSGVPGVGTVGGDSGL